MKILVALLVIGAVLAIIVARMRAGSRANGPYRRKFESQPDKGSDSSFLYTGAIAGAEQHRPAQDADCTPLSDGGSSCGDGGSADSGGSQ